jgi:hypothetical protein
LKLQICAAGALLNVLGPELCDENAPTKASIQHRRAFVKTITATLVASILQNTFFTKEAKSIIFQI